MAICLTGLASLPIIATASTGTNAQYFSLSGQRGAGAITAMYTYDAKNVETVGAGLDYQVGYAGIGQRLYVSYQFTPTTGAKTEAIGSRAFFHFGTIEVDGGWNSTPATKAVAFGVARLSVNLE